jgi:hypothetical protein
MLPFLAILAAACVEPPPPPHEPPPPPPPTAAEILTQLENDEEAGHPDRALELARQLVSEYAGTPEATSATELIPTLEAAVEAAAEAERIRAAEAAAAEETRKLAAKWSYRVTVDPMTSRESRFASIGSENSVSFDFPYEGVQHATLTIRNHASYGRDAIVSIERGQFLCPSYANCQIRVRFDEAAPERWSAVGPADNSSTAVFIRNQSGFVYQHGEPMFEFHVGGFDHERYTKG